MKKNYKTSYSKNTKIFTWDVQSITQERVGYFKTEYVFQEEKENDRLKQLSGHRFYNVSRILTLTPVNYNK
jgi:hypothetical protein